MPGLIAKSMPALATELSIRSTTPPPSSEPPEPPRPRPRTPTHETIVRNRRRQYLSRNESYFNSSDLELTAPLLYDTCIRRFQTPAEREAEGRAKGWSGILHADLERAEAKLNRIREEKAGRALDDEEEAEVQTKEEGLERWREWVTRRFVEGNDPDADYEQIDNDPENDDWKERERMEEEKYFEEEEAEGGNTDTGIQDF